LGKIGLPLAAQFAAKGMRVIGCDVLPAVIDAINSGHSHVREEAGLEEAVASAVADGRLRATLDTPGAAAEADVIVVIVAVIAWYVRGKRRPAEGGERGVVSPASGHVGPGARGVCFSVVTLGSLTVPVGHHLVGHGLGEAELDEALDLVGHDLVAGGLDRGDEIFDGDGGGALGHL